MTNAEILKHHIAVCDAVCMDTFTQHVDLARSLLADLKQRDKLLEAAKSVVAQFSVHPSAHATYVAINKLKAALSAGGEG
jgi:hypothetical protein